MAASTEANVGNTELGFAEIINHKWKLLSHFFPSKIGGKPAWLGLHPVPGSDDVKCAVCGKPCIFLLQVYAPFDENPHSFHRTVYLFVCRDAACNKSPGDNFIVLRSQLARDNTFYSSEPPEEEDFQWDSGYPTADKYQTLCRVCGCAGPKTCAKCHVVNYCGRDHQVADWKDGHKTVCGKQDTPKPDNHNNPVLFPELDLVTEPEDLPAGQAITEERTEDAKLQDYKKFMQSAGSKESLVEGENNDQDLENMATKEEDVDQQFLEFKERISAEPDQMLRYQKGGSPLWVSSDGQAQPKQIHNCSCGAERQFEFQVMPQLLNNLKVDSLGDSLDWGTLAVYTCSSSCHTSRAYHREYLWKQNFIADTKS